MTKLQEHDAMICRACGNEERASEGFPCVHCGTFICVMCNMRGVVRCRECQQKTGLPASDPLPA
jgi:hypothetical protein